MFALVGLLLLGAALPLSGQLLVGRVGDGDSKLPLQDVALTVLHPDGHALTDPVFSGESGDFVIRLPGPGEYYLRADLIGYTSVVDGIFEFDADEGRLDLRVFLVREPLEIEGVDVRIEQGASRRALRATGFFERAASGFGDFLSPEEIRARGDVPFVSDHLRGLPGLRFLQGLVLFQMPGGPYSGLRGPPAPGESVGRSTGLCEPNVWLDGALMNPAGGADSQIDTAESGGWERGLDDYILPDDILAIEIYRRPSAMPLQWQRTGSTCGAIVIWTKRGGR